MYRSIGWLINKNYTRHMAVRCLHRVRQAVGSLVVRLGSRLAVENHLQLLDRILSNHSILEAYWKLMVLKIGDGVAICKGVALALAGDRIMTCSEYVIFLRNFRVLI